MTKKMHRTRRKMPKYVEPTVEGKCPLCKRWVGSIGHHLHDKHHEIMGEVTYV